MKSLIVLLAATTISTSAIANTSFKFCDPENHMYTTFEKVDSNVKITMVNTDDNDTIDLEATLIKEGLITAPKSFESMGEKMNDQVSEIKFYTLTSEEIGDATAFVAAGTDNNFGLALRTENGVEYLGSTNSCNE